jgi:hypothetical protein
VRKLSLVSVKQRPALQLFFEVIDAVPEDEWYFAFFKILTNLLESLNFLWAVGDFMNDNAFYPR